MLSEEDRDLLKRCVYDTPLTILNIRDQEQLDYISKFIPYSTGFEIECDIKSNVSHRVFDNIPYLIENKSSYGELRFRIPSGVKGIICLYLISRSLKENATFNPGSGIHYHIDFTDGNYDIPKDFININQDWILSELDTWKYGGNYNKRAVTFYKGNWFVFRGKTIEIRCGNMTFEYKELIKTIIHANSIVRRVKSLLEGEGHVNKLDVLASSNSYIDKDSILAYISDPSLSVNRIMDLREKIKQEKLRLSQLSRTLSGKSEQTLEDLNRTINSRIE
jgi:hypothetical protein